MSLLRGMLHLHSSFSYDGHHTVREMAGFFRYRGYQFIALTEHDNDFDQEKMIEFIRACQDASSESFAVIPGLEFRCRDTVHILGIGLQSFQRVDDPLKAVKLIKKQGGLAVLAHPRGYEGRVTDELIRSLDGVEIWNGQKDSRFIPHYRALLAFRRFRDSNPHLLPLPGSDLHRLSAYFPCDLWVEAPRPEPSTILRALKEGKFSVRGRYWKEDGSAGALWEIVLLFGLRHSMDAIRYLRDRIRGH